MTNGVIYFIIRVCISRFFYMAKLTDKQTVRRRPIGVTDIMNMQIRRLNQDIEMYSVRSECPGLRPDLRWRKVNSVTI